MLRRTGFNYLKKYNGYREHVRRIGSLESDLIKGIEPILPSLQTATILEENKVNKNLQNFQIEKESSSKTQKKQILNLLISNLEDISHQFLHKSSIKNDLEARFLSQKVNLLILNLKNIIRGTPPPIRIGIKTSHDKPSLLNAILGDPLSGNQEWYFKIKNRDLNHNHLVIYDTRPRDTVYAENDIAVKDNRELTLWQIRTPILHSDTRLANFKNLYGAFNKTQPANIVTSSQLLENKNENENEKNMIYLNDMEFLEINNEKNTGNCNVLATILDQKEEDDILYESFVPNYELEEEELDVGDGCHLYLYHGDSELEYPINEIFPYLLVVDKSINDSKDLVRRKGKDSTSPLEIDSLIAQEANELLMEDFGRTSEYISLLTKSNLLKFVYNINLATQGTQPMISLLKIVNRIVSIRYFHSPNNEPLEAMELSNLQKSLTEEIQSWAREANGFLQHELSENLNKYEKKALPWWKLPLIADDLEYYLIEMINSSLKSNNNKTFMDQFNYIEGKIDSYLPFSSTIEPIPKSNDEFLNKLSPEIINLQNSTTKVLTTNLIGVMLPTTIISLAGSALYGVDGYTVGAIISLGAAVTINGISKHWFRSMKSFKEKISGLLRNKISKEEIFLQDKWNSVYEKRLERFSENIKLIENFRKNIKDFEKKL